MRVIANEVEHAVETTLNHARDASIAVLGDFCVDHYLFADSGGSGSELSVETGLPTRAVSRNRFYPGGAANVAANLASLGAGTVHAVGVLGDDSYGRELRSALDRQGASTYGLLTQREEYATNVYIKIYENGVEDPRLDIGRFNRLSDTTEEQLVETVKEVLVRSDVLIVNQQLQTGVFAGALADRLKPLFHQNSTTSILVDSRHQAGRFPGSIRKINEDEARKYFEEIEQQDSTHSDILYIAEALSRTWNMPIIVTRGENGCVIAQEKTIHEVPGIQAPRPIDPVGAGDSFLAATALGIAGGLPIEHAAAVGNLAASEIVTRLYQAGQIQADELMNAARRPPFRFNPELATSTVHAHYFDGTDIEIVTPRAASTPFRHAIFDHDGTISVLREGWEPVMSRMMVEAILGEHSLTALPSEIEEIEQTVEGYISDTTGIQSIEQMRGLVRLVEGFGLVPSGEICSPSEYKQMYLQRLNSHISDRVQRVERGYLSLEDVTIKGSVQMLRDLKERGVALYLASGSDHADVEREARLLGYSELFEGRIYGSVDDIDNDPKRIVLERILREIGTTSGEEVITFGDGPVEIRETHAAGGTAVGVASDEVRRYGLNRDKRRRLILAGASHIVPDFSEGTLLLDRLEASL